VPDRFTETLGYERAVEAFESPAMRAHLVEVLRGRGTERQRGALELRRGRRPAASRPTPSRPAGRRAGRR
jgi:hypothetical protein